MRRVAGESMLPALRPGGIVLAHAFFRTLRAGDVVIARHDGLEKIKRIRRIEPPRVFLVGDNPGRSTDSRQFGWLDERAVIGKVVWPRL